MAARTADSQPMAAVLGPCDNICRLLTPPSGARELRVKSLLQVLPAVEEGAAKVAVAWARYTRHIDGSAYKTALRVAQVALGTMTQAVQACRQVDAALNPLDDDAPADDAEAALSASGDGMTAAAEAQAGIIAHAVALVSSVNRARLTALRPAVDQLRAEVDLLRDAADAGAVRDAAAACAERTRATWPLYLAAAETQRATLLDTFKVPPSVHEVLGVAQEVGAAIRGKAGDEASPPAEDEPEDPIAAIRASFRLALAENTAGPSPAPHGKGFSVLLSRAVDVQGAHDLPRAWLRARNTLAAGSNSPAQAMETAPIPWSSIATLRDDPGGVSRGLAAPQQVVLGTVANHLHTAIGRYPANMTAFYAMAVVLCDGLLFFEPFAATAGQLPAAPPAAAESGSAITLPSAAGATAATDDGRHRCLLFVQPDRVGGHFPDCALDNIGQAHAILAVGADKLLVEISRIVHEARTGFEVPPASDDSHQTSGALLTVLCSAAQPLLMVFSKFPTAAVASLMELFVSALAHLVDRFVAEWVVLSRRASGAVEAAALRDERLFRRFFTNHPTLVGKPSSDEAKRRARLFGAVGWSA